METKQPASTDGAKGIIAQQARSPLHPILKIPQDLGAENLAQEIEGFQQNGSFNEPTLHVEVDPLTHTLTHGSATAAYANYQAIKRMRREDFLTFPQWLEYVMAALEATNQLALENSTLNQTTA